MRRTNRTIRTGITLLFGAALAFGQGGPPPGVGPGPDGNPGPPEHRRGGGDEFGPPRDRMGPGGPVRNGMMPGPPGRPPMERAMGRWWNNPELAARLALTADQKKRMEDILQQHRLKLIDLHASVQKAEAIMEPLMAADQPDEAKVVAQIDQVAQARAELEKANARMLLGIRQVLTPEQWKKLKEERERGPGGRRPMEGGNGRRG
jgi:periplasmic protein CpxP/Spy